jgi:hypothetical protein
MYIYIYIYIYACARAFSLFLSLSFSLSLSGPLKISIFKGDFQGACQERIKAKGLPGGLIAAREAAAGLYVIDSEEVHVEDQVRIRRDFPLSPGAVPII